MYLIPCQADISISIDSMKECTLKRPRIIIGRGTHNSLLAWISSIPAMRNVTIVLYLRVAFAALRRFVILHTSSVKEGRNRQQVRGHFVHEGVCFGCSYIKYANSNWFEGTYPELIVRDEA